MNFTLTLDERKALVALVWPGESSIYKTDDRCRAIADLERDPKCGTPTLSRIEREAVGAELAKYERTVTRDFGRGLCAPFIVNRRIE
jgi:hypothetical protein